jgi:uncharacterized surface protein with fasciclin (FAS1) repeats
MIRTLLATTALAATVAGTAVQAQDIVDVAVGAGNFTTLVAAVTAAGLVDTLKGPGPFTVFAPTDAAFAALPAGTVEGLLNDIPTLTGILTYHVVAAKAMSGDLAMGCNDVPTVNGANVTICRTDAGVTVNGANVVTADIEASNGVIHVIDAVILPPAG